MAWNVALLENTIEINETIANDLFALQEDGKISSWPWHDVASVIVWRGTKLDFNPDHMEHMDFLWEEKIQEVLCRHNIKGIVKFGDLESSQQGEFWGYEFDGKGGMKKLKGNLQWINDCNVSTKDPCPECGEPMKDKWSGIECTSCPYWFCY